MNEEAPATVKETVGALSVRVGALEHNVRDLGAKIDNVASTLSHELRSGIDALTGRLSDNTKTPWASIWAGLGVMLGALGMLGNSYLIPLQADVAKLKADIVPRVERDHRDAEIERHFTSIEAWVRRLDRDQYQGMRDEINRLKRFEPKPVDNQ
jgi:hypothetical protein